MSKQYSPCEPNGQLFPNSPQARWPSPSLPGFLIGLRTCLALAGRWDQPIAALQPGCHPMTSLGVLPAPTSPLLQERPLLPLQAPKTGVGEVQRRNTSSLTSGWLQIQWVSLAAQSPRESPPREWGTTAPGSRSAPSEPFLFCRECSLPMGPSLCSVLCPEPCSESLIENQRG